MSWIRRGTPISRRQIAVFTALAAAVATLTGITGLEPSQATSPGPGRNDNDWNAQGTTTVAVVAGVNEHLAGLAVATQNRPVVAAYDNTVPMTSGVSRGTSHNVYDRTFGDSGAAKVDFSGPEFASYALTASNPVDVAVDDQNRVLLLTTLGSSTDNYIALTRFTADGTLDLSWSAGSGHPGTSIIRFYVDAHRNFPTSIAVDGDNYYVAGARRDDISNKDRAAVVKFLPNGLRDDLWGPGGTQISSAEDSVFRDLAVTSSGDVIAAGYTNNGVDIGDPIISKFAANGNVLLSGYADAYPSGRIAMSHTSAGEYANAIAVDQVGGVAMALNSFDGTFGAVMRLDENGDALPTWNGGDPISQTVYFPTAVSINANAEVVAVGRVDNTAGFLLRYGTDGLPDTSFGEGSFPGFKIFNYGGTSTVLPRLAIDREGRSVVAYDNFVRVGLNRYTGDQPSGPTDGTKILFDDQNAPGTRANFAISTAGEELNEYGNTGLADTDETPVADQGGGLFYAHKVGSGEPHLYYAASDDGYVPLTSTPGQPLLHAPWDLGGVSTYRPSVGNSANRIGFLTPDTGNPGRGCFWFVEDPRGANPAFGIGTACNLMDAELHPFLPDTFAFVRDGNVYIGNGPNLTAQITNDGLADRVTWGADGLTLLFDRGHSWLSYVTYASGQIVGTAYSNPIPPINTVFTDLPNPFTSFAMAPDAGTKRPVVYSSGADIFAVRIDGSDTKQVFHGITPRVNQWQRNFSIYPLEGGQATLEPSSIPVGDVPLQSKSPAAQQTNPVQASGLLKLNILSSPILKLNILSSPLLKLNVLSSGLIKLNILSSPVGLKALGAGGDLANVAAIQKGLDQISLATLPITTGAGWLDRIRAVGTADALALAKLPLQEISLGDVLDLSPAAELPGIGDMDLTQGPFGTLSVLPFLLGDTRLHDIGGIEWCNVFEARGAANCGQEFGGLNSSLIALQIAGFNLDDLPTTGTHVNDLRAVNWEQVHLDPDHSLLPNIILNGGSVNTYKASVGGALVKDITPSPNAVFYCAAQHDALPAGSAYVDCNDPHLTVDAAKTANGLRPDAEVGALGNALNGFPLNELALGLWGEPGDDPYDQPPADLGINLDNAASPATTFVVSYTRTGLGAGQAFDPTIKVQLPAGFEYRAGTSEFLNSDDTPSFTPLPEPTQGGGVLSWDVLTTVHGGGFLQLKFRASAVAPTTGQAIAQFDDGYNAQQVGSQELTVLDQNESDDYATSPLIQPDKLYFGRLSDAHDVDYFRAPVRDIPPGTTMTVYLSQLRYDADLTMFHPADSDGLGDPLRSTLSNAPEVLGLGDTAQKVSNSGEPLIGDGDADVPLIPGLPLAGLSTNRGTKAERIETITWPGHDTPEGIEGDYVIQVSGFNGAYGPETYALRYTLTPPPSSVVGTARAAAFGDGSSPAVTPLEVTDHPQTLILTNPTRLAALYGGGAATVASSLTALAGATQGKVFPVDSVPAVRAAYGVWDARPSDPDRANDVVRAINAAVDSYLGAHRAEVKSIIVAGTDEVIPMARLQDLTQTANERSFAQDLLATAASTGGNNALLGPALSGRILSDDPYGAFAPRRFSGTYLYIPDVALGRLVETPAQIQAAVNQYLTPVGTDPIGTLRPSSTLSAGADFMTTLAESIKASFAAQLPGLGAANRSLISNTWNRTDITNELVHGGAPTGGSSPSLIAVNAHYSPQAFAPASKVDPNFPGDPLVTAANLTSQADLTRRLFFSMGCHSGYNITDYLAGGTIQDWPSAAAGEPVTALIGNTGFGIGVKNLNAFSQKLFAEFAANIGQTSLGNALTLAKQEYLADGITNVYDYKVIAEAVYFGIPQYTIAGATLPPAPPAAPTPSPSVINGGLQTSSLTLAQPTNGAQWSKTITDDGAFWNLAGGSQAIAQFRPVQPKLTQDVTVPNQTAASSFITGLKIGDDEPGFDPVLARPVIDSSAREPEVQFGDMAWPTNPSTVTNFTGADGINRQRLVTVPAQFTSTGFNDDGQLIGLERRYSRIDLDVLYRPHDPELAADTTDPSLTNARAVRDLGDPTKVDFSVVADDPESGIVRALVLYRLPAEDTFRRLELVQDTADPTLFSAQAAIDGDDFDYVVEAMNGGALTSLISNKGHFYNVTVAAASDHQVATTYSIEGEGNVFPGPVTVHLRETIGGVPVSSLMHISVNSAPETTFPDNDVALTDDGTYVIDYRTDSGLTGSITVVIQTPTEEIVTVTLERPFDAAPDFYTAPVTAHVQSSDAGAPPISISIDGAPGAVFADNTVPFTTDGDHTLVYTTDRGTTNAASPFHVKLDANPPVIQIDTPADGDHLILRAQEHADFTCVDPFLLSCVGTLPLGSPINTSTVTDGVTPRTFSVNGEDQLHRTASATSRYHVSYQPASFTCIDGAGHQTIGKVYANKPTKTTGQSLHVIFRVCDAAGASVTTPELAPATGPPREVAANGTVQGPALGGCNAVLGLLPICTPTSKRATNFVPLEEGRWGFHQDTSQLSQGLHRFRVFLRDGSTFDYVLNRTLI